MLSESFDLFPVFYPFNLHPITEENEKSNPNRKSTGSNWAL